MSTQSKTGLEVLVTPEESVLPRRPFVRYMDGFGLRPHLKAMADRLASQGEELS
jgi:dienelactone hydrolase